MNDIRTVICWPGVTLPESLKPPPAGENVCGAVDILLTATDPPHCTVTLLGEYLYGGVAPCIDTCVVEELFGHAVGPVGFGLAERAAFGLAERVPAALVVAVRAGAGEVF